MLPMTREWVAKAESDYDGACEALRSRKKSRRDRICFFSQQCIEKYLKSRLTEAGVAFPRTHASFASPPGLDAPRERGRPLGGERAACARRFACFRSSSVPV